MKNLDWVKELAEAERRMEETGIIDLSAIHDETRDLQMKTNEFLKEIKENFIEYATAFNNMKNSTVGGVKIYGISNTIADFMLFRNGYKLLFTAVGAGRVAINFQAQAAQFAPLPGQPNSGSHEEVLEAHYGPFGELSWSYRGTSVKPEYLVRYYLSRFVRESAK
jgi:hypothetical protein